jgi:peptidoglycan L-alanyl-D-glutamate endopeptidase CwlK
LTLLRCRFYLFCLLIVLAVTAQAQHIEPFESGHRCYYNRDSIFLLRGKIDEGLLKIWYAYPQHIKGVRYDALIWTDNEIMLYRDTICDKITDTMLVYPDLEEMMSFEYDAGEFYLPDSSCLAGRIRFEPFFRKMYGNSKAEVQRKLRKLAWVPKIQAQIVYITTVNGIDQKLQKISNELEQLPKEFHKYLKNIGGTFNWRAIKNTNGTRMSLHSFAIAIDINTKHGRYWDWDKDADGNFEYKNEIPKEIVEVFERHGFIWGGRWRNYDTMHFEYRPELLLKWNR